MCLLPVAVTVYSLSSPFYSVYNLLAHLILIVIIATESEIASVFLEY